MKHREATINILAGAAILIAIALSVNAWMLWNERKLVLEETNKLQTELTRQIRFANEHSDYKTYQITLLEKQKKLEQQVEHNLNLNNILQRLQKQAQAQSIQLSSHAAGGKSCAFAAGPAATDSENKCCRQFLFPAALAAAGRTRRL